MTLPRTGTCTATQTHSRYGNQACQRAPSWTHSSCLLQPSQSPESPVQNEQLHIFISPQSPCLKTITCKLQFFSAFHKYQQECSPLSPSLFLIQDIRQIRVISKGHPQFLHSNDLSLGCNKHLSLPLLAVLELTVLLNHFLSFC